ncbi:MAG: hypothetical protein PF481_06905 [Bacteroidales bacterium]|jgi:hypothetical protein|nr:hypothetical protein [Bacteroidales bacterium]
MAKFHFFTNYDLLKQEDKQFGSIPALAGDTKDFFRACSLHTSVDLNVNPKAYAITSGILFAQKVDDNLLNLIIKPIEHSETFEMPIKYFIYRGVKKESLINGDIVAAKATNDLTTTIWKSQEIYNATNEKDLSPGIEALGLHLREIDDSDIPLDFDDPYLLYNTDKLSKIFNRIDENFMLPVVKRGWEIGEFDPNSFGLEIVIENISYEPTLEIVRSLDHIIEVDKLPENPTIIQEFKHWHSKEEVLNYIDPAAYFGSFYNTVLKTKKNADLLKTDNLKGLELYNKLLYGEDLDFRRFLNYNKVYIDIRNEHNLSFNYYLNYGTHLNNSIKVDLNEQGEQDKNFYETGWPYFCIKASDFSGTNTTSKNKIILSLPLEDEDQSPLLFYSQAITFNSFPDKLIEGEKFLEPKTGDLDKINKKWNNISLGILNIEDLNNTPSTLASHIKLRYLREKSIKPYPKVGFSISEETELDNIFLPFSFDIPFEDEVGSIGTVVYHAEAFVDLRNLKNEIFVGKIGYSLTNELVTLFAIPLYQKKYGETESVQNGVLKLNLSDEVIKTDKQFLEILGERYQSYALTENTLNITGTSTTRTVFKYAPNGGQVSFSDPNLDDFYAVVFTRAQYLALETLKTTNFAPNYNVFMGLRTEDLEQTDEGEQVTRNRITLRGWSLTNETYEEIDSTLMLSSIGNIHTTGDIPIEATDSPEDNIVLTQTVGLEYGAGGNIQSEVRAIQDRLIQLGFPIPAEELQDSESNTQVENVTDIIETIIALADFTHMAMGIKLTEIGIDSVPLSFLNQAPTRAIIREELGENVTITSEVGDVELDGNVGDVNGGGNAAADHTAVRDRLMYLGYLEDTEENRANNPIALNNLIAAIKNFNFNQLGGTFDQFRAEETIFRYNNANTLGTADVDSRELKRFNHPFRFNRNWFTITDSVGTDGNNLGTDVRTIQDRLFELQYLSEVDYLEEQVEANNQTIGDNVIEETINAINHFKSIRGMEQNGIVKPNDETHRILRVPYIAPIRDMNHEQDGSVGNYNGSGTHNLRGNVIIYMKRLVELGYYNVEDYINEYPPANVNNVDNGALYRFRAAIRNFQSEVGVYVDEQISALGESRYRFQIPSYRTSTVINPNSKNDLSSLLVDNLVITQEQCKNITAIVEHETGQFAGDGEIPAAFTSPSGIPASFGASQVIGANIVGSLQFNNAFHNDVELQYGIDDNMLDNIENNLLAEFRAYYNYIINFPLAGQTVTSYNTDSNNTLGMTSTIAEQSNNADFDQLVEDFKSAMVNDTLGGNQAFPNQPNYSNRERFTRVLLLEEDFIDRIFKTAKLIRNIRTVINGSTGLTNDAMKDNFLNDTNPTYQTNFEELMFREINLSNLFSGNLFNEVRQSFITSAVLNQEQGQALRNILTDNRGRNATVASVLKSINDVSQLNLTTNRQRMASVAYKHNAGPTDATPPITDYVASVLDIWDNLPQECEL